VAAAQDCCQPFLSGQVHPRSAPELARARITASLTGWSWEPLGLQQLWFPNLSWADWGRHRVRYGVVDAMPWLIHMHTQPREQFKQFNSLVSCWAI